MAIVDMRKMHLLGLKKEQDKILSRLQEIGAVEIIDIAGLEEDESKVQESTFHQKMIKELSLLDSKISKLMFGIEFLEPFVKKRN
jgi:V/A-type H+-transporting ATPase subunit I